MKTYAKLAAGALKILERVPNVSNATAEQMAAYAAANGYKELRRTAQPGMYYTQGWHETAKLITETWAPWELDAAKADALAIIQRRRDAAMNGVTIPCEGLPAGIAYNAEALTMANSLVILSGQGQLPLGTTWTDAADVAHPLTPELLAAIVAAMFGHVNGVQARFATPRDSVNAAEDVDAVEAALNINIG